MKNIYKLLILFILLFSTSKAQIFYVSPGLKIGYVFGEGPCFGAEITVGVFYALYASVAVGFEKLPNDKESFSYVALQGGSILPIDNFYPAVGLSIGKTVTINQAEPQYGTRLSIHSGLLYGLLVYEHLRFPTLDKNYNTLGVFGKYPVGFAGNIEM